MKKKIFAGILALAAVLALVCIIFAQGGSGAYVPAADEIALRIQFDTKEDLSLIHSWCQSWGSFLAGRAEK